MHFDALKHAKVHHFLPLSEDKIVLFEVFSQKLLGRLAMLLDSLPIFIVLGRLEKIPPPATLFEYLEEKLSVVTAADESSIVLEQLPLEIQVDRIAFIQRVEEFGEHLLFGVAYESFRFEISVLRQVDLELFGE